MLFTFSYPVACGRTYPTLQSPRTPYNRVSYWCSGRTSRIRGSAGKRASQSPLGQGQGHSYRSGLSAYFPLSATKRGGYSPRLAENIPCCCQGKMSGFNVQRFCQSDSFQTTKAVRSPSATSACCVAEARRSSRIRFNVGPEMPNSLAACRRVMAFCSS